jgi:hypothetical protein
MSTISTPIRHSTGIPSQSNYARIRNKRNTNRERNCQNILFADDMIPYLKDPKKLYSKAP